MVLIFAYHCSRNSDKGQSAEIYSLSKLSSTTPLAEKQMEDNDFCLEIAIFQTQKTSSGQTRMNSFFSLTLTPQNKGNETSLGAEAGPLTEVSLTPSPPKAASCSPPWSQGGPQPHWHKHREGPEGRRARGCLRAPPRPPHPSLGSRRQVPVKTPAPSHSARGGMGNPGIRSTASANCPGRLITKLSSTLLTNERRVTRRKYHE